MIGKLSGIIDSVKGSQLVLDVQGVGYLVTCSARTLRQVGANGTAATLRIETQVREDAISLFGFADTAEQDWFRLLTTVQGVGAKVALAILGAVGPEQLGQVIAAQDKSSLTQAEGVGPKLALRIVTELKDKAPSFMSIAPAASATSSKPGETPGKPGVNSAAGDAISALLNLGYRRVEAYGAVAEAARANSTAPLDELIRLALAELGRKDSAA